MIGIDEALYKACEDNRKLEVEIKEKDKEIERLNNLLQQKENIIKEVRELVVKLKEDNTSYYDECLVDNFIRDSLEILDKEDK